MRIFSLILLIGCIGSTDDDDDDDDDDDNDKDDSETTETTEPPPFVPDEGEWTAVEGTVTTDDCDLQTLMEEGGDTGSGPATFTIENARPNGFDMVTVVTEGPETFNCSLAQADKSFDCPAKNLVVDLAPDLPDTRLLFSVTAVGAFTDETHMQADQTSIVNCEGDSCGLMEDFAGISFPCTLGFHSRAVLE